MKKKDEYKRQPTADSISFSYADKPITTYPPRSAKERAAVLRSMKEWLKRVDPDGLLARPLEGSGWKRLGEHWIKATKARFEAKPKGKSTPTLVSISGALVPATRERTKQGDLLVIPIKGGELTFHFPRRM